MNKFPVWFFLGALLLCASGAQARTLTPMERALQALHAQAAGGGNTLAAASDPAVLMEAAPGQANGTTATAAAEVDPFALTATATADAILLSWANTGTAMKDFSGYLVSKAAAGRSLEPANVFLMAETQYQDLTVTAGVTYTYQLSALDSQGATLAASSRIRAGLQPATPPGGIRDLETLPEEERVSLRWSKAEPGSRSVAGYMIYRADSASAAGTPLTVTPWAKTEYDDDRGVVNQDYYYTVVPVDSKGVTGLASAPMPGRAKPRNRSSLIWTSTAYPGHGRPFPDFTGDLQFTYYIGTLYGQELSEELPVLTYLDPISLWLLSADVKYSFLSEHQSPVAMAAGAKIGLQLFAGQQSASQASFTFSAKSQLDYIWSGYLALSRSFGNWGVHAGYMQGTFSNPIYYLSQHLEGETNSNMIYAGTEFPIARRMNAALEVLWPISLGDSRHPFLINLHVDRLLNFDVAYMHWDQGWAFLGYFNIRFTVFPGS